MVQMPGVVKKVVVIAVLAAALAGAAVYFSYFREQAPPGEVVTTGVIEATEADVSPEVPGRITWLCCEEGGAVTKGEVAFRLDDSRPRALVEEGMANVQAAAEALSEARVNLENAEASEQAARFDLVADGAEVERMMVAVRNSGAELQRGKDLFVKGFITASRLDNLDAAYGSDLARLRSAEAKKLSARANLKNARLNIKSARARVLAAEARKKETEAHLEVLKSELDDTVVRSPITGTVDYRAFEEGEMVRAGDSVYTLYDLATVWARVDIEETLIDRIALGSEAEVWPAGSPQRVFKARVREIGQLGGFATLEDVRRGRPDIKTFRVEAVIDDPRGVFKPGMTVKVRLHFAETDDQGDKD